MRSDRGGWDSGYCRSRRSSAAALIGGSVEAGWVVLVTDMRAWQEWVGNVGVSYADAVRLLGGSGSRVVTALDRLTGGLLLAATAAGSGLALSLFEARAEFVQLGGELIAGLEARIRGLDRFRRSERLAAAHAVIVLTAFFDALEGASLPFDARLLELTAAEQVALAGGGDPSSGRLRALAGALLRAEVPLPAPQCPYEDTITALREFYVELSEHLLRFVSGLAVYERVDETRQEEFAAAVCHEVPDRAVAGYEELFSRLAVQFPEMAFWASLIDHQATRRQVRQMHRGLEDLERVLSDVAAGRVPDERRAALWRAHRAVLDRSALTAGSLPGGLEVPSLGASYVNPDYRVAVPGTAERFGEESWWADKPVHDDLAGFLAGHLTAPQAVEAPLLVLGQPGSGKSVLTQVLAARLPPSEFLVVRVVLRDVAADADLQAQIEHAVRAATGESLPWADLARAAGDALPVILLDGFDELLQATGVTQTDYLKKVADFQGREVGQDRPAAVVVTSRSAVADRALPVAGMVVVRLEPFRDAQIGQWLQVWNEANAAGFARLGLEPLPLDTVLAHPELAVQPLLLTMLALYDADGNRLQRGSASLSTAELYERLLVGFAEREVDRTGAVLSAEELHQAVERELLRLSVAAFAMFNRGRQWVTEAELNADLSVLLGQRAGLPDAAGLRAPLTEAQVTLGRFFFIYESQATREGARLRSYEFLHGTFGEYLLARLAVRELGDIADAASAAAARNRPTLPDDAFLHALTSFMPLSMRGTVVSFAADQLRVLPASRRDLLSEAILDLFREALNPRYDARYRDYMPLQLPVPARCAAYSANLLTLAVLAVGELSGGSVFRGAREPVEEWRKLALLWRSQLPREGWTGLIEAISLDRVWEEGQRAITLRPADFAELGEWRYDPYWTQNMGPEHEHRPTRRGYYANWVHLSAEALREQARFTPDEGDDAIAHALEPFADDLGAVVTSFHGYWHDRSISAANALITLWLASSQDSSPQVLAAAYDTCLLISISGFAPYDTDTRKRFRTIVLRQLAADYQRLPQRWLATAAREIKEAGQSGDKDKLAQEGLALLNMAIEIIPELMSFGTHHDLPTISD
jgi:hypothetical protein